MTFPRRCNASSAVSSSKIQFGLWNYTISSDVCFYQKRASRKVAKLRHEKKFGPQEYRGSARVVYLDIDLVSGGLFDGPNFTTDRRGSLPENRLLVTEPITEQYLHSISTDFDGRRQTDEDSRAPCVGRCRDETENAWSFWMLQFITIRRLRRMHSGQRLETTKFVI